jgi:metabotropic X receptor
LFINTPQAAEVMLYTVDKVNSLGVLPPPLKLGAYVLDDCDKDTYGLQQAVDFIKGKKIVVSFFINFLVIKVVPF